MSYYEAGIFCDNDSFVAGEFISDNHDRVYVYEFFPFAGLMNTNKSQTSFI